MDHARVRCEDCGFAWYGEQLEHGLRILGHCSRCGGGLRFRDEDEDETESLGVASASEPISPSRVLGVPLSWD